jgi:uncharacterized protein YbjQ (UPF0145 family)
MLKLILAAVLAAAVLLPVHAADRKHLLSIEAAMADNGARERLGDSVKFYFGDQPTPRIIERFVSDKTSQKTNGFGKSVETSCNWVFLSAMIQLQKRAQQLGANAVVNIVSNYNNVPMSSMTEFECHDGAIMSGVALKGDFVRIETK